VVSDVQDGAVNDPWIDGGLRRVGAYIETGLLD